VDYAKRQAAGAARLDDALQTPEDGRIKLLLTQRALSCRREHAPLFTLGSYEPVAFEGEYRQHAFGFLRRYEHTSALCVVPRLASHLAHWSKTSAILPQSLDWQNVITGERCSGNRLPLSTLLGRFPVALLIAKS
jgi:(1->4)-alpha-D-glucan 1-alpha-D-glucosylmutase